VPSCAVIAEGVSAYEMADAFLEKFGSDSMVEIKKNFQNYLRLLEKF